MSLEGSGRAPLVEIVPNFSEGRRPEVIDAILEACRVPGVRMLTWQADPDHNRLDASLVGSPEAVRRSALSCAAKAAELIDMEQHHGNHPRMGAVDVIPFLPIRDISMDECVDLAREVAKEIGETLGIPVYCYDHAALTPERQSLADLRKGEYEGLKADVAEGRRLPDFGPHEIGKAGAVAVGARKPLIAFNVYLDGTDEAAAKDIARRVRESSGGLKNVRSIGFFVEERGCVTVSMNLVDTDATPIYRALELVRTEASRYGLNIIDTEIVGMSPEAALTDTAAFYLQLKGFNPDEQILERVLASGQAAEVLDRGASTEEATVHSFLQRLASSDPTPGGGTAAAVVGAAGAALVAMVARLTTGKKGFETIEARMAQIAASADDARATFLDLADRDAASFDAVMRAFRLPKETDEEKAARRQAIQRAMAGAAEVPLETARAAVELMEPALEVTEAGIPTAASDGAAAAELLAASCRAAVRNVEINAAALRDQDVAAALRQESRRLLARADESAAIATEAFTKRL
jgi:glutamate formiminotransferase/formiminotetrahydrofolate cyclodeaminase